MSLPAARHDPAQGSLVESGKGPPALDDVMLSCAEEDLPITALLNVSRFRIGGFLLSLGGPEHRD